MSNSISMEEFAEYITKIDRLSFEEKLNIIDMFVRGCSEGFIRGSLDAQQRAIETSSDYTIEVNCSA